MPARQYNRNYRCGSRGYVWLRGQLLDQILDWLTNIRLTNGGAVTYNPTGIDVAIPSTPPTQRVCIVKLVGGKDMQGYYEADVYGNGSAEASTQQSVSVALRGFDITIADPQGYYLATPIVGEPGFFEVVGQTPAPPASGTYYLRSVDGVLGWYEAGQCASGV